MDISDKVLLNSQYYIQNPSISTRLKGVEEWSVSIVVKTTSTGQF